MKLKHLATSLACLMICLMTPQVSNAGIEVLQVTSAKVISANNSYDFDSGWYVTDKKMTSIANGAKKLQAQVKALTIERDAYKEAYEKLGVEHENLKLTYKTLYDTHEQYKLETASLIKNYEDQINFYKRENYKLKKNATTYKWLSGALAVGGIIALCK